MFEDEDKWSDFKRDHGDCTEDCSDFDRVLEELAGKVCVDSYLKEIHYQSRKVLREPETREETSSIEEGLLGVVRTATHYLTINY